MAAQKIKAGVGECFACHREVVWRKTEGGALSCFCQHCDLQSYAKDGTEAERLILKSIEREPAPEAAPTPAPKPDRKETPPPRKGFAFGLGGV